MAFAMKSAKAAHSYGISQAEIKQTLAQEDPLWH
jgi:hypothetical protein